MQLASGEEFFIRTIPLDDVQLSTQTPALSNCGWHELPLAVFQAAGKSDVFMPTKSLGSL